MSLIQNQFVQFGGTRNGQVNEFAQENISEFLTVNREEKCQTPLKLLAVNSEALVFLQFRKDQKIIKFEDFCLHT